MSFMKNAGNDGARLRGRANRHYPKDGSPIPLPRAKETFCETCGKPAAAENLLYCRPCGRQYIESLPR